MAKSSDSVTVQFLCPTWIVTTQVTAASQNMPLKRKKLYVFPTEKLSHGSLNITAISIVLLEFIWK